MLDQPVNAILGLERGTVRLVPYTPAWAELFEDEKAKLSLALKDWALDIQHIGSTAIPGGVAKPIIDIGIAVADFDLACACVPLVVGVGYEYQGENGIPRRHYFVKRNSATTHHIHMFEQESRNWQDHILFRDYLRDHPEEVNEYTELKIRLAEMFPTDREAYTNGKGEFISRILALAISI